MKAEMCRKESKEVRIFSRRGLSSQHFPYLSLQLDQIGTCRQKRAISSWTKEDAGRDLHTAKCKTFSAWNLPKFVASISNVPVKFLVK